ncbi:MAG: hypothetical protein P9L92_06570 [Candidatus Electryonea clarkiae]|nr:hypothetical protein [Candidatus Electryonea clarkiae]MDP8285839.1 hypothetical protein [Candidatus Electryonea clarkiae]
MYKRKDRISQITVISVLIVFWMGFLNVHDSEACNLWGMVADDPEEGLYPTAYQQSMDAFKGEADRTDDEDGWGLAGWHEDGTRQAPYRYGRKIGTDGIN